jgi:DNA-directed RNA polymerase subunit D
MACEEACVTKAIKVDSDKSKFVFEFETDGSLSAQNALLKALEILENKFEEFKELVSTLES